MYYYWIETKKGKPVNSSKRPDQNMRAISHSKKSGDLAVKITSGDVTAINQFVEMNYRWLLFIVRRKFSKSNNHEDIVQDSFMLVIGKLQQGKINQPKTIMAYLRTTAINIGFEYLRKDKKFTSAIDQDFLDAIEDAKNDILSTLIWDDKVKYVKQVLSELKIQRDKDILINFYFEDRSKSSICKKLQLSSEHFDRVLYRAKQRLMELINKKDDRNSSAGYKKENNKSQQRKTEKSSLTLKVMSLFPKIFSYIRKYQAPKLLGENA